MATIEEFATTCILWGSRAPNVHNSSLSFSGSHANKQKWEDERTHVSLKVGLDEQHELLLGKPAGAGRAK